MKRALRLAALALAIFPAFARAAEVVGANPKVSYDAATGVVSIQASQVSLDQLLKKISQKSGLEVRSDSDFDKTFSINLPALPLKDSVNALCQEAGLSYALISSTSTEPGKPGRLVLRVLSGPGKGGSASQPASQSRYPSPGTEKSAPTPAPASFAPTPPPGGETAPPNKTAARERIEKRLATMPESERDALLKIEEERQKKREEREAARSRRRGGFNSNQPKSGAPTQGAPAESAKPTGEE